VVVVVGVKAGVKVTGCLYGFAGMLDCIGVFSSLTATSIVSTGLFLRSCEVAVAGVWLLTTKGVDVICVVGVVISAKRGVVVSTNAVPVSIRFEVISVLSDATDLSSLSGLEMS
jgi:hypothetical protein